MIKKSFILIGCLILGCHFQASAQSQKNNFSLPSDSISSSLLIPNAFTPNNDGHNDIFKIQNFTSQRLVEFKIFNRWGTILFHNTDPNIGWDGTYRNKPQQMGVYGYVIRIAYPNKVVETYKGTVTLIR